MKSKPTTPRNFVAKHAKTSGAGQHTSKRAAANTRAAKHKKPPHQAEHYAAA